jgi:hypothetical protein
MSNMSALFANDIPGPACGAIGCKPKGGDLIATGPHAVPVFWLSLFEETHLVTFETEDEDDGQILMIPSLVAEMSESRRLLEDRRERLAEYFPEFQPTWGQYARVVGRLKARYIKVDVLELWDIAAAVDEDFEAELRGALRWFESQDEADFNQLLSIASITGYDPSRRTFAGRSAEVPRAFHLRGYACNDRYWDDESDI